MQVSTRRSVAAWKPASARASAQQDIDSAAQSPTPNFSSGSVLKLLDAQARRDHSLAIEAPPAKLASSRVDVDVLVATFTQRFAATAQDPLAFHALLRESFGGSYDQQAGEALRQRALVGDFSWLPSIEVVDASVLVDQSGTQGAGTAMGAYDAANDRILLNSELLDGDAGQALDVLTEEIGHSLDARLNVGDTAGDEGAVFVRLFRGDILNTSQLAALRAENDGGTVLVDGQEVTVEYDFWSDTRDSVTGAVDSAVDSVSGVVDSIGEAVSDGVQWVGDTLGDGVDSVYEHIVQPVLENTGAVGEFIDDHVARPFVGLVNDAIDIGTNIVDSVVDLTTHLVSNNIQTLGRFLQGDLFGVWDNIKQTAFDVGSDTLGAIVENFAMTLHAATSLLNGVYGLSETRGLNEVEITYLQTIYGDSIDYSEINIQQGGIESWGVINMDPHTIGGDIYLPDEYFVADDELAADGTPIPDGTLNQAGLELLSHEVAHVWQFQNAGAGYLSDAIGSYVSDRDGAYDFGSALESLTPWEDLTPDQQAEFGMLIGMAQATDGEGPIMDDGINAAITEVGRLNGDAAIPDLTVDQFAYMQNIQQRFLDGEA